MGVIVFWPNANDIAVCVWAYEGIWMNIECKSVWRLGNFINEMDTVIFAENPFILSCAPQMAVPFV